MPASRLTPWTQTRGPQRLGRLLLVLMISFAYPSYARAFAPRPGTLHPRKHTSSASAPPRKGADFPKDLATAVGVVVAAVVIGTTVICVFAHCWRQILDCWGRKDEGKGGTVGRKKLRKEEEAWFHRTNRGLPMPQFNVLEPETEPLSLSMQALEPEGPCGGRDTAVAPAAGARYVVPGQRATLPSWLDAEGIGRPASVAYVLDRP
ncbi:hypothetical protein F5Y14DRAFT_402629 [Nemania sp. NC0429]|nr:hypothetical protein F5Y14DRAFT_402629 [Nemania sp. NC0429]